jgi:chemotaxis regulatin CheY-phosphate phosphatase CheZ
MTSSHNTPTKDETYEALRAAVARTPRGRWFLEEFAKRNRQADTNAILEKLDRIQGEKGRKEVDNRIEYLHNELQQMASQIVETRREIASIKPEEGGNNRIMAATEELDAIISSTERATAEILTHAERLQALGEKLREEGVSEDYCDTIEQEVTQIFMACSFQDITGQRTTKVVNVLRYLEARINGMIRIWGDGQDAEAGGALQVPPDGSRPFAHLLHGPQADGGVSQDDVDRMLDEDGNPKQDSQSGDAPASASQDDIDALFR